jgi:hypothetical protein
MRVRYKHSDADHVRDAITYEITARAPGPVGVRACLVQCQCPMPPGRAGPGVYRAEYQGTGGLDLPGACSWVVPRVRARPGGGLPRYKARVAAVLRQVWTTVANSPVHAHVHR